MYPKEFRHTQHSLLQKWLVSAHFSGHCQTCIPELMEETRQYCYNFLHGFWYTGLMTAWKNWPKLCIFIIKCCVCRTFFRYIYWSEHNGDVSPKDNISNWLEYLQRVEEDRIGRNMLEAHRSTEGVLGDLEWYARKISMLSVTRTATTIITFVVVVVVVVVVYW